jgi:CRISPR-associated protein Cas2
MSMTVVVTRNVSDRMRGFLASTMLELAPGVYASPHLNVSVRKRIWEVVSEWFLAENEASVVMLWGDSQKTAGMSVRVLGLPPIELRELDGLIVSFRT